MLTGTRRSLAPRRRARRASLDVAIALAALSSAVVALSAAASGQVLQQRIVNALPAPGSIYRWFGTSVDISGDALIVGAPGHPFETQPSSGVAIYERSGGTWTLDLDLLQAFAHDTRAGWDVAIDGDWAAFGVFGTSSSTSGEVRIYQRVAGNWVPSQTLTAPIPDAGLEFFGSAIDIDGDLMAVGSTAQITAWVYRRQGSTWVEEAELFPPAGFAQGNSGFGESIAISDTPAREAVIVGQPLFSPGFSFQDGAAHIFVKSTSWNAVNSLTPPFGPADNAWFGRNVAIDGNVAVVGAVRAFEFIFPETANGVVEIYRWNVVNFAHSKEIVGLEQEMIGWAVAADGDRVYVGRPGWNGIDAGPPLDAGRVTGERWTGSAWTPWPADSGSFHRIAQPLVDTDFGEALAAADGSLVVCTPRGDVAGMDQAGSICVLDVSKEGWKWSTAQIFGADVVMGSTGPAILTGEGSLGGGDGYRLHLHDALPSTLVAMFVGLSAINAPFKGGVLVPNPQFTLWFPTNASGNFHVTTTFPNGVPSGVTLWHHMWWPDPAGPAGFASSNAIRGITP